VFGDFYPSPNLTSTPNFRTTNSFERDIDQFTVRVDHRISDNQNVYGRFTWAEDEQFTPQFVDLNTRNAAPILSRNGVFNWTQVISPNWVNVFTFGASRIIRDTVREPFGQDLTGPLGLVNDGQENFRLPVNNILGFDSFGGTGFGFGEIENTYQFAANSTLTKGSHTWTFGTDIRNNRVFSRVIQQSAGSLLFDTAFTGNSVANFVLGIPREISKSSGVNTNNFRWTQFAAYVQDDWKASPRLTLNIGLRWNFQQPVREIDAKTQTFDLRTGVLRISRPLSEGGVSFPVPGVEQAFNFQPRDTHWKNFEPRFGFAWRPLGGGDFVIRGGYGIFYTINGFLEDRQSTTQEPPFFVLINQQSGLDRPELSTNNLWPSAADGLRGGGTINLQAVFDPSDNDPYVHQWNLGVETRVNEWLWRVSYVGKAGVGIALRHNVNEPVPSVQPNPQSRRPFPNFGPILGRFRKQNTSYNALETSVRRHFAEGLSVLASYTWSHSIDIGSREPSATVVQDFRNLEGSRGNSAFDVRHRFSTGVLYDLPIGPGGKFLSNSQGFLGKLVGGWQVNTMVFLNTGNHNINLGVAQDIANIGPGFRKVRPNVTRDPNLPRSEREPTLWFDTDALQLQPFGQFGNVGRNVIEAPGLSVVNFGLFKDNQITERFNLQFRAEFFNFLNNANFFRPGGTIDGANFGVITGADRPREIQFGLKLIF